jgi:hypothetical protein
MVAVLIVAVVLALLVYGLQRNHARAARPPGGGPVLWGADLRRPLP